MRCHPDRQWRGINPPPHIRRLQPSLEVPSSPTPRARPLQGTHDDSKTWSTRWRRTSSCCPMGLPGRGSEFLGGHTVRPQDVLWFSRRAGWGKDPSSIRDPAQMSRADVPRLPDDTSPT
ncbi:unnamed protein product [Spirodela intermedia]|uniref:Uncharacterized protein n=1 Tax=Spirodela intermedia TaxID=51605 RepID=A0A7I8IZ58_SPIIN|nr:unnamed protein product [Spirodela intermedia]CAA6663266.1 unnamed protein product [Spirodela intermedia]